MKGVVVLILASLFVASLCAEDVDDFEESSETVPCWPRGAQLIKVRVVCRGRTLERAIARMRVTCPRGFQERRKKKPSHEPSWQRANENCPNYAKRVCAEAKTELLSKGNDKTCSLAKCQVETGLRCPFRDLVRARANQFIKNIAVKGDIWDESKAGAMCDRWYGGELSNVTHIGAVWDVLQMLPCPEEEAVIRNVSCFRIDTANISPTHPMAKFCYTSYPVDLNIGLTVSTQCCYGADLRLLVLGHKGAGSIDFSSKLSAHENTDADHFLNDLYPSLACCALSDNCVKYSAVRPAMLLPETTAEVVQSCNVMQHIYDWHPYKTFPPPYARPEAVADWHKLNLTATSLVPTTLLAKVLKEAQDVRKRIHANEEPYPPTTTAHAATTHTTEEEISTTHRPAAAATSHTTEEEVTHYTTEEETSVYKPTSAYKPTTHKAAPATTRAPEKRSTAEDKAIDKAIEAVLTAQTKHEAGGKAADAKEKAADAKEKAAEAKEDEAIEREEAAASSKSNEGKNDKTAGVKAASAKKH